MGEKTGKRIKQNDPWRGTQSSTTRRLIVQPMTAASRKLHMKNKCNPRAYTSERVHHRGIR